MMGIEQVEKEGLQDIVGLSRGDGDPDVHGYPGEDKQSPSDEDLAVGFAMLDLTKAIQTLKKYKPFAEYSEIDKAQSDLAQLLTDMDKPF